MSDVVLLRLPPAATAHPRHRHPALDLKYVQAGVAAAGGEPPPLLEDWRGDGAGLAQRALATGARLAVIKAESGSLDASLACAARLREGGVVTVAVGQQVAHWAGTGLARWPQAFDLALLGEPEEVVPALVRELAAGASPEPWRERCQAAYSRRQPWLVERPDQLVPPRFAHDELGAHPFPFPLRGCGARAWAYVLTAWGCPRPCRHCSAVVRKSVGQRLRQRSAGRVADEVARLADQGAQAVAFEDDSLFVDPRHLLALCDELVRRGPCLPWLANARPDELDEARVAAAAGAGAVALKVGVDSGSARLVEHIGKATNGAAWLAAAEAGFARLNARGIASVALFMVGLPDETEAEADASIALAQRLAPDYVQVQLFSPYPDIALWPELPAAVRGTGPLHHSRAPAASASRIAADRLVALQRRFYREFYLRPGFALRHLARSGRHTLRPAMLRDVAAALGFLLRRPRPAPNAA